MYNNEILKINFEKEGGIAHSRKKIPNGCVLVGILDELRSSDEQSQYINDRKRKNVTKLQKDHTRASLPF